MRDDISTGKLVRLANRKAAGRWRLILADLLPEIRPVLDALRDTPVTCVIGGVERTAEGRYDSRGDYRIRIIGVTNGFVDPIEALRRVRQVTRRNAAGQILDWLDAQQNQSR